MKATTLTIALFCSTLLSFGQMKFDDVTLPGELKYGSQSMNLNGGGIREKYFLDLYVGGLYLTSPSKDAAKVMNADEPMAIRLHIISSLIDSEKMIDAVDEGMENSTDGNPQKFASETKAFKNAFMEEIEIGDIYDIVYLPGTGVEIHKNGKKHSTIKGYEYKKALFGIWLCDDPADEDLKEGMLNQ